MRSNFLKIAAVGVALFAVAAGGFQTGVNRVLARHEDDLRRELTRSLGERANFMRVRYTLWDGVLVENFRFGRNWVPLVRLKPALWIARRPGLEWRVTLHRARFTLRADAPAVARLARQLAGSPRTSFSIGRWTVPVRLASFEIRDSTGLLVSPDEKRPWRQRFEGLRVFFGRHWLGGEKLVFQGHIAGRPEASFRIRARVRGTARRALETTVRFDCRRFTTAYLKPHLKGDLRFPDEDLTASVKVRFVHGRKFSSEGRLSVPKRLEGKHPVLRVLKALSPSVRYRFRAEIEGGRARLTDVEIKSVGIRFAGSGDVALDRPEDAAYDVRLESDKIPLTRLRPAFPDWSLESGSVRLSLAFTGRGERTHPSLGVTFLDCSLGDRRGRLRAAKLDGRVTIGPGRIAVEDLWAFVNDFPVGLKGELSQPDGRLWAEISTFPGQLPSLRAKNPMNADLRVEARRDDGGRWNGHARLKRVVTRDRLARDVEWRAAFRGMRAGRVREWASGPPPVGFDTLVVGPSKATAGRARRIVIRRALVWSSRASEGAQASLRGAVCDGRVTADLRASFRQKTWNGRALFAGVLARPFLRAFGTRTPLEGRLNGELVASGPPSRPSVQARLHMGRGAFGPHPALERLSDQTGIELGRIPFVRAETAFTWRPGELDVDRAALSGPDAKLKTSFRMRRGGRLAGTLSAAFPESAVRRSSQLAWLMRFVGGRGWIDFDFKVAGNTAAPRIQWLGGEFKRKVEKGLAPWMRNILAREVEKRMARESS